MKSSNNKKKSEAKVQKIVLVVTWHKLLANAATLREVQKNKKKKAFCLQATAQVKTESHLYADSHHQSRLFITEAQNTISSRLNQAVHHYRTVHKFNKNKHVSQAKQKRLRRDQHRPESNTPIFVSHTGWEEFLRDTSVQRHFTAHRGNGPCKNWWKE